MPVFKRQLREALSDPSRLPGDELSEAVQYDEWSDEEFLQRLWRDLYGDETPSAGSTLAKPRTSGNGGSSRGFRSTWKVLGDDVQPHPQPPSHWNLSATPPTPNVSCRLRQRHR